MKKKLLIFPYLIIGFLALNGCGPVSSSSVLSDISSESSTSNPATSSSESSQSSEESSSEPTVVNLSQDVLTALSGAIKIDGVYHMFGYTREFTTIFNETSFYNSEYVIKDGIPQVRVPFDNEYNVHLEEDGKSYAYFTTPNNEVTKIEYPAPFTTLANPFKKLKVTDFVESDTKGVFIINNDVCLPLVESLTNWGNIETIEVKLTVTNNIPTHISAKMITNKYDGEVTYDMGISEVGTAKTPDVVQSTLPEHAALQTAFNNFVSENYTASVKDSAYSEEENAVIEYNIYHTENLIYNDLDKNGYVLRGNDVYSFDIDPDTNKAVLGTLWEGDTTPFDVVPVPNVAPELFRPTETGYSLYSGYAVPDVAGYFGLSVDLFLLLYKYGTDLNLKVDNDKLTGIEFNYSVQNLYSNIQANITNNGTTTLPTDVDFADILNPDTPTYDSIPELWYGTYTGTLSKGSINGETEIELTIGENSVIINGVEATNVKAELIYETEQVVTFTIHGINLCITNSKYDGTFSPFIFTEDYSITGSSFVKVEDPTIPTAFVGTWTGTLSKGTIDNSSEVTLVITETTVTVNGNETTGLEIYLDPGYETVNFVYGGITFTIMNASYDPEVFKTSIV